MSILCFFLSAILLVTATVTIPVSGGPRSDDVTSHAEPVPKKTDIRLPKNVIPINYTIELEPHFIEGNFMFDGVTTIDISVKEKVKSIIVHALGMNISDASVSSIDGKKIFEMKNYVIHPKQEFMELKFDKEIEVGNYKLKLKYVGEMTNGQLGEKGFYRNSYVNEKNETVYLAVAHFEPTRARHAFPCFDEPALKAHFNISIKHFKNYTALSNMPAIKTTEDTDSSDKIWTHFDITPLMSTYLVSFTISDFKKLSNKKGTINIWAREKEVNNGKYALEICEKQLEILEKYFDSKHVIPKMDLFANPNRVDSMGNWGLATFGEQYLLYNEKSDPPAKKESIAQRIAHELTTQWFGNLVTPAWWEHSWLKAGFATYFQNFVVDEMMGSSQNMDRFVVAKMQSTVLLEDSREDQHALSFPVEDVEDIMGIYDEITYSKGATIIRMFADIFGRADFQKALQRFLKTNKYSAVTPNDLLDALLIAVQNSTLQELIKDSFNSYVNQAGYPVVSTKNSVLLRIRITSKRYLTGKPINHYPPEKWTVPIYMMTEDRPTPTWHVSGEETEKSVNTSAWYIINKLQTGYYRVNYDLKNWKLLAEYLKTKHYNRIHLLDRAQLLDDSFNLARSGHLQDYTVFFNISAYLGQESDLVPWYPAFRGFGSLENSLKHTPQYDLFKQYIVKLIAKLEKTVGYSILPGDDRFVVTSKQNILTFGCLSGSEKCRDVADKELIEYINGGEKLSDFRLRRILCAGLSSANETIWNKTLEVAKKKNDEHVLHALGCSSDSKILKSYLEMIIAPKSELSEYAETILNAVSDGSVTGPDIAFDFLQKNFAALGDIMGDKYYLADSIINMAKGMNTRTQLDKFAKFIESLPSGNAAFAEKLKEYALVEVEKNVMWCEKHAARIETFLETVNPFETTEQPPISSSTTTTGETSTVSSSTTTITGKPPTVASTTTTEKPPTVASTTTTEKPPTVASTTTTEKPPTVASTTTTEKPPTVASTTTTEKPPTVASTTTTEKPPTVASTTTTEVPSEPSVEPDTDGTSDGPKTCLSTLSLTIFLALLARYA